MISIIPADNCAQFGDANFSAISPNMADAIVIDPLTLRSVEMFLSRISGDFPILEAWLYGSRARGDAYEDSDIDVAVVLKGPERRSMDVAMEMVDAEFDVMMETGRFVQALPVAIDHWLNPSLHSNPFLIANIKREGVRLEP